jgi:MscS family membrane protein
MMATGSSLEVNGSYPSTSVKIFPTMRRLSLIFFSIIVCLFTGYAQVQKPSQPPGGGEDQPVDPLGRTAPRNTLYRFMDAAQKGNYLLASRYLQLKAPRFRKDEKEGEELAKQLKILMDRYWTGHLSSVSDDPGGRQDDGLSPDLERAGTIQVPEEKADLLLIRSVDREVGKIWLISADTLKQVPDLYEPVKFSVFEENLPNVMVETQFLNMPLWQWVGFFIFYPIALAVAWLILSILRLIRWAISLLLATLGRRLVEKRKIFKKPGLLDLLLMLFVHYRFLRVIGVPLLYRQYYGKVAGIPIAIAFYLLMAWLTDFLAHRLEMRLAGTSIEVMNSLLSLGRRALKMIFLGVVVILVIHSFGFNVSAILAGIGIGGIALGLGAQKTIENLFGGISVVTDRAFQVGDFCKIGDEQGTVEDIGLRSTRIRTVERTIVTIPNGALANANLENLSQRDKILFRPVLALRYETSADQLRYLLAEIRKLLYQHPKVESSTSRARLLRFGQQSADLEVFSYVLTNDYPEFLAIQEDLLLRIMDLIQKAGTSLAFPSQTLYLSKDAGKDQDRSQIVEKEVERWRKDKEFPFPNHDPATISKMENTLEYPPPESALRKPKND